MGKTDTAKIAVKLTMDGATAAERQLASLSKTMGSIGRGVSAAGHGVASFSKNLFFMAQNIKGVMDMVSDGMAKIMAPSIDADLWREKLQFIGLSADEARAKIQELLIMSQSLGQPHKSTISAYTELRKFGGEPFASKENMDLISRAAKYTDTEFAQMAGTIGSLYNKLQQGKDFGRAAAQLRDMGLLGGELLKELEGLENDDTIEKLTDRIKALSEEREKLFPSQRGGLTREIAGLQDQLTEAQNAAPQDMLATLWPKVLQAINDKTSNVNLADQTYADKLQVKKDLEAEAIRIGARPVFQEKMADVERFNKRVGGNLNRDDSERRFGFIGNLLGGTYHALKGLDDPIMFAANNLLTDAVRESMEKFTAMMDQNPFAQKLKEQERLMAEGFTASSSLMYGPRMRGDFGDWRDTPVLPTNILPGGVGGTAYGFSSGMDMNRIDMGASVQVEQLRQVNSALSETVKQAIETAKTAAEIRFEMVNLMNEIKSKQGRL